ncbi:MAG TPA: hypothetical protein VMX17_14485 [Candidatus Glassbacteria bacterium]|nr:hypothetical protein [Candidatus Glassbacteria bacterium]
MIRTQVKSVLDIYHSGQDFENIEVSYEKYNDQHFVRFVLGDSSETDIIFKIKLCELKKAIDIIEYHMDDD